MQRQTPSQRLALKRAALDCGHPRGNYPPVKKGGKMYCCEACSQCAVQQDQALSRVARLAGWVHGLAALFILAVMLGSPEAKADGQLYQGRGIMCDTKEQVEAAIRHYDDGKNGPEEVNKATPGACGIIVVIYRIVGIVGSVQAKQATLDIVEIEVIAVHDGTRFAPLIAPHKQMTVMNQKQGDPPVKPSADIQF